MKRVLVLYYSQTGQLENLLHTMLSPLQEDPATELTYKRLVSSETFGFPWNFFRFFDAFPETVYLDPPKNVPLALEDPASYDLVILGYQPWFLSPSMPMSAFMLSHEAQTILCGKPVVTVVGCRNMWIEAHKTMQGLIDACGARLIDNVVLTDQSGPMESFVTTPRWMLTGKKEPFWGFSPAGISPEAIARSRRFGERLVQKLHEDAERQNAPMLDRLGAVVADARFVASEKIAKRSFRIWGGLIRLFGKRGSALRRPVLAVYVAFLITLIVTVVPLNMALQAVIRRLFKAKTDRMLQTIEAPSGR